MPYYKVTWQVCVRAKDKAGAMEQADEVREPGDCTVEEVPKTEAKRVSPEMFEGPWPSVTFVLQNGETWQGEGTFLEILEHFRRDGLDLRHVVAIIPTQE